jgi:putative Holliday junction resolvase
MRVLAVDFGEKRIGLAVSDESGTVVVPVGAVYRKSDAQAAAAVSEAALERDVARIVVGHPVRRTRNFARRVAELSGLPVDLHGEGLTTVAAERNLIDAGLGPRRRKKARDAESAAVLLRDYFYDREDLRRER